MLDIQRETLSATEGLWERIVTGSQVLLQDLENAGDWEVTIVSSDEADPATDRISDECPIGEALLGRRAGDTIRVEVPLGTVRYRVVAVSRPSTRVLEATHGEEQLPSRSFWDEP